MNAIDFQNYKYYSHAVTIGGKVLEIPLRSGEKDTAFIDALTFTVHKHTIDIAKGICINDTEYAAAYSEILIEIFGFGITEKRPGRGRYFYHGYYRLGPENAEYGTLHIGGQRDTILIELTGTGCQAAKSGWEQRLYEFLKTAKRPQITRVDCAHDFFNGEYTPEQALIDHNNGLFNRSNVRPKSELKGTAWREEDYTGKSFYVGRRGSSKLVRVYEKGRQLGDKNSLWTRFEIEFRNKDCIIPLEILAAPGEFLSGAYPVGEKIFTTPAQRIAATTEKANITFDSRLHYAKNQVGRLVRFLADLGWSHEQIIEALIADEGKYPKGLDPLEYNCQDGQVEYLTTEQTETIGNGITEPDQLDHVVKIDTHIRGFQQETSESDKQPWQKQLLQDYPKDLKNFMSRYMDKQRYFAMSEADFKQFRSEREANERELDNLVEHFYFKYGTLFPHSKTKTTHPT